MRVRHTTMWYNDKWSLYDLTQVSHMAQDIPHRVEDLFFEKPTVMAHLKI